MNELNKFELESVNGGFVGNNPYTVGYAAYSALETNAEIIGTAFVVVGESILSWLND